MLIVNNAQEEKTPELRPFDVIFGVELYKMSEVSKFLFEFNKPFNEAVRIQKIEKWMEERGVLIAVHMDKTKAAEYGIKKSHNKVVLYEL